MTDDSRAKAIADRKGIKIVWLARQLNMSVPYVSKLVNGWASERVMRRWGRAIAALLGEPVEEVFPEVDWSIDVRTGRRSSVA